MKNQKWVSKEELEELHLKSGGWISNAVNPKHRGYCTPISKATCTPHRKALAERFKHGDLHHANGGTSMYNGYLKTGRQPIPIEDPYGPPLNYDDYNAVPVEYTKRNPKIPLDEYGRMMFNKGGKMCYSEGGTYDVSDEEYNSLLKQGYKMEVIK